MLKGVNWWVVWVLGEKVDRAKWMVILAYECVVK